MLNTLLLPIRGKIHGGSGRLHPRNAKKEPWKTEIEPLIIATDCNVKLIQYLRIRHWDVKSSPPQKKKKKKKKMLPIQVKCQGTPITTKLSKSSSKCCVHSHFNLIFISGIVGNFNLTLCGLFYAIWTFQLQLVWYLRYWFYMTSSDRILG